MQVAIDWMAMGSDKHDAIKSIYLVTIDESKFDEIPDRLFNAIRSAFSDAEIEVID